MNTPRWYMLDKMGMATLCTSKKDAEKEARAMDMAWPHMGPHRAVQLVEVADVEAMRAALAKPQTAPQQEAQEPVAWMTQEGDRVTTAKTMNAARRDGGAMLTSLRSYSVALVRAAAQESKNHD